MGITARSIQLIEKAISPQLIKNVMELGAQNLYDKEYKLPSPYASTFYEKKGIKYGCIDLNGENNAIKIDLEKPQQIENQYDLVTDFGTGEHVRDAYNVLSIIHDLTKINGIIIRQNPKTGNWKGHGFWYITQEFYREFCALYQYEIIELGEDAAMGNEIDGWNVYCIYRKTQNSFIERSVFKHLKICSS